jgi:hypothetical protein
MYTSPVRISVTNQLVKWGLSYSFLILNVNGCDFIYEYAETCNDHLISPFFSLLTKSPVSIYTTILQLKQCCQLT